MERDREGILEGSCQGWEWGCRGVTVTLRWTSVLQLCGHFLFSVDSLMSPPQRKVPGQSLLLLNVLQRLGRVLGFPAT